MEGKFSVFRVQISGREGRWWAGGRFYPLQTLCIFIVAAGAVVSAILRVRAFVGDFEAVFGWRGFLVALGAGLGLREHIGEATSDRLYLIKVAVAVEGF